MTEPSLALIMELLKKLQEQVQDVRAEVVATARRSDAQYQDLYRQQAALQMEFTRLDMRFTHLETKLDNFMADTRTRLTAIETPRVV